MRLKKEFESGERPQCKVVSKDPMQTNSSCHYQNFKFEHQLREGHHVFIIPIGARSYFKVDGFDESEGVFRRAFLSYHTKREERALLKFQLFVSSCTQN